MTRGLWVLGVLAAACGGPGASDGSDAAEASVTNPQVDATALPDVASADHDAAVPVPDGAARDATDATTTDVAVITPDAAAPVEASAMIGPSGGTLAAGDLRLDVPPGAVAAPTRFTVDSTAASVPAGYTAYSPRYTFGPAGTTFASPVTVTLPFTGDARRAALFWSRTSGNGYDRVGGAVSAGMVHASVTHFSDGFVADGVDLTPAPDRTCAVVQMLDARSGTASIGIAGGLAMTFVAHDCAGNAITGLGARDLDVRVDGTAATTDTLVSLRNPPPVGTFALLAIDLGTASRASLAQVIGGAHAFVDEFGALAAPIGIVVFAGDSAVTTWQPPTLDRTLLATRIDALGTYAPTDATARDVRGAIVQSLALIDTAEDAFVARNHGGAAAVGELAVFTSGDDTSARVSETAVLAAETASARNRVTVIANGTFDTSALARIAPAGVGVAPTGAEIAREFGYAASRAAAIASAAYQLGYCSPARSGTHHATVGIAGATASASVTAAYDFDASAFGAGCSAAAFASACSGASCGGVGCGACDDRTASCDAASRQCVDNCATADRCGGAVITNALGYAQTCADRVGAVACGSVCVDTRHDTLHCGACSTVCPPTASCVSGACVCPGAMALACGTACRDGANDVANCGACGRACAAGASCVAGACTCPAATPVACGGLCRNVMNDANNCGACGHACPGGCTGGTCDAVCSGAGCATVAEVKLGTGHGLARMSDGTVRCWGRNDNGECPANSSTVPIAGLTGVVSIAAGRNDSFALTSDHLLHCWGATCGAITGGPATPFPGLTGVAALAVGMAGTGTAPSIGTVATSPVCVVRTDGTAACLNLGTFTTVPAITTAVAGAEGGATTYFILGDGTVRSRDNCSSLSCPPVSGLANVRQIVGGQYSNETMARLGDGTVVSWTTTPGSTSITPTPMTDLGTVASLSKGQYGTCAVRTDGGVRCWGTAFWEGVRDGSLSTSISGLPPMAQVSAGSANVCGVVAGGGMRCWGNDFFGQVNAGVGVVIDPGTTVTAATGDLQFLDFVRSDGTVGSAGDRTGLPGVTFTGLPVVQSPLPGVTGVTQLSQAPDHGCARLDSGAVRCWGDNGSGQSSDDVGSLQVAVGGGFTCSLHNDHTVYCRGGTWGRTGRAIGVTTATQIAVGDGTTASTFGCAVIADGTVRCWGDNTHGQLGGGSPTVSVPGLANVVQVAAGDLHTCAVLGDGTVRCWGEGSSGQLGGSSTTTPVPGITTAVAVSAIGTQSCALLADHTVRCWGTGDGGRTLGGGLVPGVTDAVDISGECGRRANGTIVCWGWVPHPFIVAPVLY